MANSQLGASGSWLIGGFTLLVIGAVLGLVGAFGTGATLGIIGAVLAVLGAIGAGIGIGIRMQQGPRRGA